MLRSLFVLSYDDTYNGSDEEYGILPSVYLVPSDRVEEVKSAAKLAHVIHNGQGRETSLSRWFEIFLDGKEIEFQYIGNIELTFGERRDVYLNGFVEAEMI